MNIPSRFTILEDFFLLLKIIGIRSCKESPGVAHGLGFRVLGALAERFWSCRA